MKNLLRIYRIMLRHWGYMAGGAVFMFAFALCSGVSLTMVIPLFDYVFRKGEGAAVLYTRAGEFSAAFTAALRDFIGRTGWTGLADGATVKALGQELKAVMLATDPFVLLYIICGAVLGLILVKNLFFYCNRLLFATLRGITIREARAMIFRKYLYQSLAFFNVNSVGDSIIRITADIDVISNLAIASTFNVSRSLVLIIVYAGTAILLNARLFLVSIVLFPVYGVVVNYVGQKIKKYARRLRLQSSAMFSNVVEKLGSMHIVKVFAREESELKRFNVINHTFYRYWRRSIVYSSLNVPLSELNGTVVGIIILIIGGSQVIRGTLTLGGFTAFLFAMFSILRPMKVLTKAYMSFKKASVSLDRVSEIMDREEDVVEAPDSVRIGDFSDRITLRNVFFTYVFPQPVLENVSLDIEKGRRVAIVGRSGSGKTTLVNLLPRLYDITSGELLLDGIPVRDLALKDLRTLFGMVTQESHLFCDTIRNNIAYGSLRPVSDERVREAARIAYAEEFIRDLPGGYGHQLNPKASNLSGGQKQRLCIARAIVGDPPILIFDEATSALDSEAEQKVQKAIEQATANRTVVVIAHRLSTVLSADTIVMLEKGRIVGNGPHRALLETCEQYKALYDLQFRDPG